MKVITFSKEFPKYHINAGESTWFVQKILMGLVEMNDPGEFRPFTGNGWPPKYHTIRVGHRWKVGDKFSARTWTDKPYRSKQEEFAQLEIKKIWDIEIDENGVMAMGEAGDQVYYITDDDVYNSLAENDGLTQEDLYFWFKPYQPFKGQIICWNDKIEY